MLQSGQGARRRLTPGGKQPPQPSTSSLWDPEPEAHNKETDGASILNIKKKGTEQAFLNLSTPDHSKNLPHGTQYWPDIALVGGLVTRCQSRDKSGGPCAYKGKFNPVCQPGSTSKENRLSGHVPVGSKFS